MEKKVFIRLCILQHRFFDFLVAHLYRISIEYVMITQEDRIF